MTDTGPHTTSVASVGKPVTGVVVIGRNEGERLARCLASLPGPPVLAVYVDSGSSDGSVRVARGLGVPAIELDPSAPFTAARGRNEGFAFLARAGVEGPEFVQFVDGDCELRADWMRHAAHALSHDAGLAVVCGRLREKHRDASVYSRLCDMEWQGPVGPIVSCGGIFMVRAEAFRAVGGFIAGRRAGEEPDLCARLRGAGWRLERIDAEMGVHDAGMTRLGQWWGRAVRAGWAYAAAAGAGSAQRSWGGFRRIVTTLGWSAGVPAVCVSAALLGPRPLAPAAAALVLVMAYTALWVRVAGHRRRAGNSPADARLYGAFCVLSKWPESIGYVRYWTGR